MRPLAVLLVLIMGCGEADPPTRRDPRPRTEPSRDAGGDALRQDAEPDPDASAAGVVMTPTGDEAREIASGPNGGASIGGSQDCRSDTECYGLTQGYPQDSCNGGGGAPYTIENYMTDGFCDPIEGYDIGICRYAYIRTVCEEGKVCRMVPDDNPNGWGFVYRCADECEVLGNCGT